MKTPDPIKALLDMEKLLGTRRAVAEALGYSAPYLTDVIYGRRAVTDKLLAKLGLRRVVVKQ